MAHYIRRNLPQKCSGLALLDTLLRNAKLIHEPGGFSRKTGEVLVPNLEVGPADE